MFKDVEPGFDGNQLCGCEDNRILVLLLLLRSFAFVLLGLLRYRSRYDRCRDIEVDIHVNRSTKDLQLAAYIQSTNGLLDKLLKLISWCVLFICLVKWRLREGKLGTSSSPFFGKRLTAK